MGLMPHHYRFGFVISIVKVLACIAEFLDIGVIPANRLMPCRIGLVAEQPSAVLALPCSFLVLQKFLVLIDIADNIIFTA